MNQQDVVGVCFFLFCAHMLCDFSLQGDTMAREKNRHAKTPLQQHIPYWYWLLAHGSTHGAAVALVTGSISLGICELLFHSVIDYAKCERWLNIHADQALHLGCKVLWVYFLFTAPIRPW